jgi:subtilase family serine protease
VTALALALTTGPIAADAAQPAAKSAHVRVCGTPAHGSAACNAIRNDAASSGKGTPNATPAGYGPGDLQSAYGLPASPGSTTVPNGPTVAIVDAYDAPSAEADLGVYRAKYGLPPCTTVNGCFKKVNQSGGSKAPRANGGWAQEISLDLDMVSATCPNCRILLVEATSSSLGNLGAAANTAATAKGVVAVSNSYGGSDSSSDLAYDSDYNHPGVAVTVSSGDSGYGVQYPASSQYVTAVGGTHLARDTSTARGWSESAWSGAGSGCSRYATQPIWQGWVVTNCSGRAVADVSAVADPNTGVAVYDSYSYQGASGWMVFGGTSVASPIIASVYALSGNTAGYPTETVYTNRSQLHDVTAGSNGSCGSALCTAGTGWDGPTGLGTPKGTSAF